jgi:hypothetical protein
MLPPEAQSDNHRADHTHRSTSFDDAVSVGLAAPPAIVRPTLAALTGGASRPVQGSGSAVLKIALSLPKIE